MLDFWPAILAAIIHTSSPQVDCSDVIVKEIDKNEMKCYLNYITLNEHEKVCCNIWLEEQ